MLGVFGRVVCSVAIVQDARHHCGGGGQSSGFEAPYWRFVKPSWESGRPPWEVLGGGIMGPPIIILQILGAILGSKGVTKSQAVDALIVLLMVFGRCLSMARDVRRLSVKAQ